MRISVLLALLCFVFFIFKKICSLILRESSGKSKSSNNSGRSCISGFPFVRGTRVIKMGNGEGTENYLFCCSFI